MSDPNAPDQAANRSGALIAGAIVAAALILSWGMSRNEPRYQVAASGDMVVRMDTDSGEMIACNQQRCARVEPVDRSRSFGPVTVQYESKPERALPKAEPQQNAATR